MRIRPYAVNLKESIFEIYSGFVKLSFYIFLFGTLSFGRAFSTIHLNTSLGPIFITEIFLLLNIPILLDRYKSLVKLPKVFLVIFLIYFIYSSYYLFAGLFKHNMFALRDIVLSGYILFLPITFIHLNNLKKLKFFIGVIILSNIINLFSGLCFLTKVFPSEIFRDFLSKSKFFNLGLYYGITISFLISFYELVKSRVYRLFSLFFLALNLFMLIVICQTSLWVATSVMFVFLFLIFKRNFLKLIFFSVFILILISSIMFCSDFKGVTSAYTTGIFKEAGGLSLFVSGIIHPSKIAELPRPSKPTGEQISELNINWRLSIWKQTLKFAIDAPLFGKGFGVYPVYKIGSTHQYPQSVYFDPWMVPTHNHLLTLFLKMGIFGLGLFLFINIYVFNYGVIYIKKCNLKFVNNLVIALLGAFVFWHTLAFFFDVIDSPPTSIFLWIITGMIFATVEIDKSSSRK